MPHVSDLLVVLGCILCFVCYVSKYTAEVVISSDLRVRCVNSVTAKGGIAYTPPGRLRL